MAFNITTWGKKGRDFGRGEPPPRGSIEYVGVGDMFMPAPPPRAAAATPRAPSPPRPSSPVPRAAVASPSPRGGTGATPYLLALGGAACLGISYLVHRRPKAVVVAVPDACREEE